MTGTALVRRRQSTAWELRLAKHYRREVVVRLHEGHRIKRVRGYVVAVTSSDRMATFHSEDHPEPVMVPIRFIDQIRRPHFHEDGPPRPYRPTAEPPGASWIDPGQLTLGGDPPKVSKRSESAVLRAAGMMLGDEAMAVLAALDSAARIAGTASTADVADELGRSIQWTVRRLAPLAEMRLVFLVGKNPYLWSPGE